MILYWLANSKDRNTQSRQRKKKKREREREKSLVYQAFQQVSRDTKMGNYDMLVMFSSKNSEVQNQQQTHTKNFLKLNRHWDATIFSIFCDVCFLSQAMSHKMLTIVSGLASKMILNCMGACFFPGNISFQKSE